VRPINRGDKPTDHQGHLLAVREASEYKEALERRLGPFCSYCERRLTVSLAVEHMQGKLAVPALELEWSNLLLACSNCNSAKPKSEIDLTLYYWPDTHNTARAFTYDDAGDVHPAPALTPGESQTASRTLELTGLDRRPGHPKWRQGDRRWEDRRDAWKIAQDQHEDLQRRPTSTQRDKVLRVARQTGYFSVWMTVFRDDADMCRRFIGAFPNTAVECFEESGAPKPFTEREGASV